MRVQLKVSVLVETAHGIAAVAHPEDGEVDAVVLHPLPVHCPLVRGHVHAVDQAHPGAGAVHAAVFQIKIIGIIRKHRHILQHIQCIGIIDDGFGRFGGSVLLRRLGRGLFPGDLRLRRHRTAGRQDAALLRGLIAFHTPDDRADLGPQQGLVSAKAQLSVHGHSLYDAGLIQGQHLRVGAVGKGGAGHGQVQAQRPRRQLGHLCPGDGPVQVIGIRLGQKPRLDSQIPVAAGPVAVLRPHLGIVRRPQDQLERLSAGDHAVGAKAAVGISADDALLAQVQNIRVTPQALGHIGIAGIFSGSPGYGRKKAGAGCQHTKQFFHRGDSFPSGRRNKSNKLVSEYTTVFSPGARRKLLPKTEFRTP